MKCDFEVVFDHLIIEGVEGKDAEECLNKVCRYLNNAFHGMKTVEINQLKCTLVE